MSNHALTLAENSNFNDASQQEFIPGREDDMAVNSAGGVSFKIDDWGRLDRFLMLGTTAGSYYASEQKLTIDNAKAVQRAIDQDGLRAVNRIVEISDSGRAPKNDPALFALAIAASAKDELTRKAALDALPKVARIGTHLFHFAAYVKNFRGYGRALRRAIANWYLNQPVDRLANQAIKYQQRDGWSHRDMLRLSHPKTDDGVRNNIFRWIVKGDELGMPYHAKIAAFEEAKRADNKADIVRLIRENDLPREAVPTHFLNEASLGSIT